MKEQPKLKMNAWAGMVLNVDLSTGKIEKEELSEAFARKYLGASGFNGIKLFELVNKDVEALSPANVIMFGTGPMVGTILSGSVRTTITARSPLTDIFGHASFAGTFGPELKYAGYDQIVIKGKADKPVYLFIDDDTVTIKDASHLWGKGVWDASAAIKEEIGDMEVKVALIGPAGEKLVRFANVMIAQGRAAGRAGMGAVMGSKNLKAIAVRGTRGVSVARPDEFIEAARQARDIIVSKHPWYKLHHAVGAPGYTEILVPAGVMGYHNYQSTVFPKEAWQALSGESLKKDFYAGMRACPTCNVACTPFLNVKSGEYAGVCGEGGEFPNFSTPLTWGITRPEAAIKLIELVNQYGIDIISLERCMGWALECYQRGIIDEKDLGGLSLKWGDYHNIIEMVRKIVRREGFGDIIAEGEKRAPQILGRDSFQYMHHVKGQGDIIEPRTGNITGFPMVTAMRGADHLTSAGFNMRSAFGTTTAGKELYQDPEVNKTTSPVKKGILIKGIEDISELFNNAGICFRCHAGMENIVTALSAATGFDFTEAELLQIGERNNNVKKAFNARQGLTRKDDSFSTSRFTKDPVPDGPFQGRVIEIAGMLDEYYDARGWDRETGLQLKQKLEELDLNDISNELEKSGAVK